MKQIPTLLSALAAFVLISCILGGDKVAGRRGSEVENELGVYGRLVGEDGDPVAGALVAALPAAGAAADTDTVMTDEKGRYVFDSLPKGSYNLLGASGAGSLVVLIPGIEVSGIEPKDLGTDTLRAPGRIRGRMLVGARGKSGVLCFIPGFSLLDVTDDSGRFEISGLPQARYLMRYSAPGFLIAPDSGVEVQAGEATVLPDKQLEYDPAFPPPEPTGLKAVYDTLSERVTLSWNAVPVSDLAGFVIYRDEDTYPEPIVLRNGFTSGTAFVDSSFGSLARDEIRTLTYRVKAKDIKSNVSQSFSDPVRVGIASKSLVTTAISISGSGVKGGRSSLGDTLRFVLKFSNPTRKTVRKSWRLEGGAAHLRTAADSAVAGSDTLVWIAGTLGPKRMIAELLDEGGVTWPGTIDFDVVPDLPSALAGRDTTLTVYDPLTLHGSAADGLGTIVSMAWDVGSKGAFEEAPGGEKTIILPAQAGVLACVFRAVDDDGQEAMDTVYVMVLADNPVAEAFGEATVTPFDAVTLRADGSDKFGRILAWEWDIGGSGRFRPAAAGDTLINVGASAPMDLPCILRVTDDDGRQALDTVWIKVAVDSPTADAGPDIAVSIGDEVGMGGLARDGYGSVEKTEWDIGATGRFVPGPLDTVWTAPAAPIEGMPCVLRVTDDDGLTALDTAWVFVRLDPPIADAGPDQVLSIGDEYRLRGSVYQDYGYVAEWGWKCGSETDFVPSEPEILRFAPGSPRESYFCILRVTDEDGNAAMDTMNVRILLDPPVAHAVPVAEARKAGDTVTLSARGSHDGFGNLKYQWTIGDASISPESETTVFRLPFFFSDTSLTCVLKVTDNDGLSAYDSIVLDIRSVAGARFTKVSDSLPIGRHYLNDAFVFKDKLWIFGYRFTDGSGMNLWFTSDGTSWTQAGKGLSINSDGDWHCWEFDGKLWMYAGGSKFDGYKGKIYASTDGVAWTLVNGNTPFGNRYNVSTEVLNGKTYLFGGDADVWSTRNGADWIRETPSYAMGWNQAASFVAGNRLWTLAWQGTGSTFAPFSSADGVDWTRQGTLNTGSYPGNHPKHVLNGSQFLMFGLSGVAAMDGKDVWGSSNGSDWSIVGGLPKELSDFAYWPVSFKEKAWILSEEASCCGEGLRITLWRMD